MAQRYNRVGAAPRIIVLLLLIVFLLGGGAFWFDVLGLIDSREAMQPALQLVGLGREAPVSNPEDQDLLDRVRGERRQEQLMLQEEEIERRRREVAEAEEELERRLQEVDDREKTLAEREESFEQRQAEYEDRQANLRRNAQALQNMPLEQAVAILEDYEDQDLVSILRITDEIADEEDEASLVPVWLGELPPERAARIQRLMAQRPGS